MSMSPRSEVLALRVMYKEESPQEMNVASNPPSSKDNVELEKAEKEESSEWALPMEAVEMGNSQINDSGDNKSI